MAGNQLEERMEGFPLGCVQVKICQIPMWGDVQCGGTLRMGCRVFWNVVDLL